MAILKDLIVHGSSRFLNKIYASEIQTPLIEADAGVFKKLKADDATVVGLLDVKGQLHTNSWSNSNIATIDGSFYITPTIGSASGTVTITASTLTFSGTNYAISSLYLGDGSSITWPQYSKVLVTGQILSNEEWIPLGTLLGQLSSTATAASISINNIKDNKNQTSNVLATLVNEGTISSNYRNLKVSLYQRASSSTAFYPLGIYMTATGINGRTFLDIYGGVEALSNSNNYGGLAEPNVRIGNLQGLPNVGGQSPSGWGIYTDNGYFKGIIAADRGYIGSGSRYWVIANYEDGSNPNNSRSYIYSYNGTDNGTNSITSTVEGIYLGTDGIRNYKDSTHNVTIKDGVITALGVNLTGTITATSGTIGGCTISNGVLTVGNANINDINASKINAGDIAAARIQTNLISAINAEVSDLSALTATIGGFQIDSSSIHTNNVAVTSNADNSIALSSADFTRTINSISRTGLRFAIGDKFGVTGDGTIYASDVDLTGKITATSGEIGGIIIDNNGKLWITDANISGTISTNHIDVSSLSIGISQVSNLQTTLDGKQPSGDYATNTALNNISSIANNAGATATDYITYIDAQNGIRVHNSQDTTNYLQLNSTAISIYRDNIETLKIEDSAIRIGKIGSGQKNVYIDSDSIDIRNNENVLASFTGEDIKFYDGQIEGLEVASFGGANGVRIGNEEETHFVINNSAVKALNNNGSPIFSIETTETLIGNTVKIASGATVPDAGGSITLNTDSFSLPLENNDKFYIEQIILILNVAASVFDEDGIICQNFQVNQTNQEITLLSHTTKGNPGNFSTISNFVSYLPIASDTFTYGTASSLTYNLSGTFSYYDGQTSYSGQIIIGYDGNNTLTFSSLINSSSFGNNKFTLKSNSHYSYSDIMVRDKNSYAPALTFGTRLGTVGPLSAVIGEALYAPGEGQMTIGKFNYGQDTQTSTYSFIVGNGQSDVYRSNAFTVDWNGNVGIQGKIHNIIISGNTETKLPLFHFEGRTWTIKTINANSAWTGPTSKDTPSTRSINVPGYTPIAIAGYSVWGGTNSAWCVVPRVYIDRNLTDNYGNPTDDMLQIYIWNQGSQAATNVKFAVEILYIADNFID